MQAFKYANSLYAVLSKNPLPKNKTELNHNYGGIRSYIFQENLSPYDFFNFRGIISLIGNDLYYIVNKVMEISKKMQNKSLYKILRKNFNLFYDYRLARNFFAHMDDRLNKPEVHGLDYEYEIPELKVKFEESAENIFYIIFGKEHLYYHDKDINELVSTPKKICLSMNRMNEIFELFREIYRLLITHTTQANIFNYPESDTIFKLT